MSDYSSIYDAPFRDIGSVSDYTPSMNREIIRVPLGDGMVLQFLQDLNGSDRTILTSTFHGARDPKAVTLPYFIRASSLRRLNVPHILFSDPTMSLDESRLRLTWYCGTKNVDLVPIFVSILGKAVEFLNARAVQYEGSSGGGFMALRMTLLSPFASAALAISPQVNAFNYENSRFADIALSAAFLSEDGRDYRAMFSDRFNLTDLLARTSSASRRPVIRYVQNISDGEHVALQLHPFADALNISLDDDAYFVQQDSVTISLQNHGPGHVAPPAGLWDGESAILKKSLRKVVAELESELGDSRSSRQCLPYEDGEFLVESSDSSPNVHYRVRLGNPDGSYIRVFFQSAVFRSDGDGGVAFRLASSRDSASVADISVSDPSLRLDPNLTAGWYIGNSTTPAFETIACHIREFVARYKIPHVLLIGQSIGGFAAIHVARRLDNSTACVFNPTMSLSTIESGPATRLKSATGLPSSTLIGIGSVSPELDVLTAVRMLPSIHSGRVYSYLCDSDREYLRNQAPFAYAAEAERCNWFVVKEVAGSIPGFPKQEEIARNLLSSERDDVSSLASFIGPARESKVAVSDPSLLKVGVYGGCVTRDTASSLVRKFGGGEVVSYIARQSIISAGTAVNSRYVDIQSLSSRWQARRLASDLDGRALEELAESAESLDVLLLDFLMERHGVLQVDNGFVTQSYELGLAGGIRAPFRPIRFGSSEHRALWRESLVGLRKLLESVHLFSRTVLFAVPWADRAVGGGSSGHSEGMSASVANVIYEPYYELALSEGFNVLTMPRSSVEADPKNKWGLAPYHYVKDVYESLASAVASRLSVQP